MSHNQSGVPTGFKCGTCEESCAIYDNIWLHVVEKASYNHNVVPVPTPIPTPASEPLCMKRIPESGDACRLSPGHTERHSANPSSEPEKTFCNCGDEIYQMCDYWRSVSDETVSHVINGGLEDHAPIEIPTPPSTEESGEPTGARECVFCGFKWFPRNENDPCPYTDELHVYRTPASESADYLRGKLDGFNEGVEASAEWVDNTLSLSDFLSAALRRLKRGNS